MDDFFEDFKSAASLTDTNQMRTPSAFSMEQSPCIPIRGVPRCGDDLSAFIRDIRQERNSAARLDARLDRLQRRVTSGDSDQPTARSALKTERGSFDKGSSYTQLNHHFRAMYRTPSAGLKLRTEAERERAQGPVRPSRQSSMCGVDLSMVSKGEVEWLQSKEDASKLVRDSSAPRMRVSREWERG